LDIGANDYLTKPFSPNELEARIRAQLRHIISRPKNSKIKNFENIRFGDLHIDLKTKFVARGISPIKLTDIEYNLLEFLIDQAGNPMSRKIILANVWDLLPRGLLILELLMCISQGLDQSWKKIQKILI
jgi:OmpR family response regulator RpaB